MKKNIIIYCIIFSPYQDVSIYFLFHPNFIYQILTQFCLSYKNRDKIKSCLLQNNVLLTLFQQFTVYSLQFFDPLSTVYIPN